MAIVVRQNAGGLDALQSAGRSLLVIVGAVPILLNLLGEHQFGALIEYFRSSDGASLITAVTALVALGYGIYKSHKRGSQLVDVGHSVPDRIITVK